MLDNSAQRGDDYDELLERASWFYEAVSFSEAMKSQTPGRRARPTSAPTPTPTASGSTAARDYTLHVPADPPAKLFWSVTVYDVATRCLIDNDQQRGDRGSRDADLRHQRRRLGRPVLRADRRPTAASRTGCRPSPGRHWFSYFRLYGPLEPYFDRSWKLGDITPA